jgi:hypothetical protein
MPLDDRHAVLAQVPPEGVEHRGHLVGVGAIDEVAHQQHGVETLA